MSESPPPPSEGRRFGRYVVREQLGAGAMGAVYLARDEVLHRDVAIKTICAHGQRGPMAPQFRERFLNEARALAEVSHPHIVGIFDIGTDGDEPFLVMEVARGRSLAERVEAGPLAPEEVRRLGLQMAAALEAAHRRGIVHRDVKPANILEAEPGTWKLADFGVAHLPESSLTLTGQFIGSPAYAAPEAIAAGVFSPASDVYGLGATLFTALVGQPPSRTEVAAAHRGGGLPSIARVAPAAPPDLRQAIDAALAPLDRRPSAADLVAMLSGMPRPTSVPAEVPASLSPALWPAAAAAARRRRIALGTGIAGALLVGLLIGLGAAGESTPAPAAAPAGALPSPLGAAAAAPLQPETAAPPHPRPRDLQKRFDKAMAKYERGKYDDAADELEKLLDRDPTDPEARAWLERARALEALYDDDDRPHRGRGRGR